MSVEWISEDILRSISKSFLRHYIIKVLAWYFATVTWGPLKHFLELLHVHRLSKLFWHSLNVIHIYGTSFVIIKKIENFIDAILNRLFFTLDSLSPSLDVIASKNSSKSI
jgi:hypothetical protein